MKPRRTIASHGSEREERTKNSEVREEREDRSVDKTDVGNKKLILMFTFELQ